MTKKAAKKKQSQLSAEINFGRLSGVCLSIAPNGRNKYANIVPTALALNAFWMLSVIYGQLANIFPCSRKHRNKSRQEGDLNNETCPFSGSVH